MENATDISNLRLSFLMEKSVSQTCVCHIITLAQLLNITIWNFLFCKIGAREIDFFVLFVKSVLIFIFLELSSFNNSLSEMEHINVLDLHTFLKLLRSKVCHSYSNSHKYYV